MLSHVINMESQIYTIEYTKTRLLVYRIINSRIFESEIDVNLILNHFLKLNFKIEHIRENYFLISKCDFTKLDSYIKSNKIVYWQNDKILDLDKPIRYLCTNFINHYSHLVYGIFDNYQMIPNTKYLYLYKHKIFFDESYYNFKE